MAAPREDDDGNAYMLLHSKKATLRRHGNLVRSSCPSSLYDMTRSLYIKSKLYMSCFFLLFKIFLTKRTNIAQQKFARFGTKDFKKVGFSSNHSWSSSSNFCYTNTSRTTYVQGMSTMGILLYIKIVNLYFIHFDVLKTVTVVSYLWYIKLHTVNGEYRFNTNCLNPAAAGTWYIDFMAWIKLLGEIDQVT